MQVVKQACGPHILYRLLDDVGCTLGRAVTSETSSEVRLHEIYVKPEYRSRGYGNALMRAILSFDVTKLVTLCTGLTNISFFKQHEFKVTGTNDSLVFMSRKASMPKAE
ncbi:MAG: GNAT family N-acetyltransferase [Candidatus Bathyarchaeota archaeon]|nr:MAG: GNAT family N-acetyltransferase [Candidatus Bathyarchaeota archaeon]